MFSSRPSVSASVQSSVRPSVGPGVRPEKFVIARYLRNSRREKLNSVVETKDELLKF